MTLRAPRRTAVAIRPVIVVVLQTLAAIAPAPASAQPSVQGQWSATFDTKNVMIHATLLPSGKVLFWSRREAGEGLNPQNCTPRIWDPSPGLPGVITETLNKPGYNLFCSSHTLLSDGQVFVAGGGGLHKRWPGGAARVGLRPRDQHVDPPGRHERRPMVPNGRHAT